MKTSTGSLLALAASLSLVAARPSQKSRRQACPSGVEMTLIGPETTNPDDQYSVSVVFGESFYPGNDPDIDYQTSQIGISSVIYDHDVASCTFTGRDSPAAGPIEKVNDQYNGQLGPPQTITEIDCTCAYDDSYKVKAREPLAPAPAVKARQSDGTCEGSTTIDVTLYAPDGSYEVTVPISAYGTSSDPVIPQDVISDPQIAALSISQVEYAWTVATCYFTGTDSPNAGPVEGDYGVDGPHGLGPPQEITEINCVCNTQY